MSTWGNRVSAQRCSCVCGHHHPHKGAARGASDSEGFPAEPPPTPLVPGGRILILDLLKHNFEKSHDLFGDRWPGFAESDLHKWLEHAGFKKIEISIVAQEEEPPHFATVLAGGEKLP